jgi:trans-aconitate methyltransferase
VERVVEPELMDGVEQAEAYARADFGEPNRAFCAHLVALSSPLPTVARVLDLGTGPADIPIRLMQRFPEWSIDAIDGSTAMLAHAARAVRSADLAGRIRLIHAVLPSSGLDGPYDIVLSNSLLHHLHRPAVLWSAVRELGRPGASVLVMDLRRPESPEAARGLVALHAGAEPAVLQRDFYNSLSAAFTPEEIATQLADAGLSTLHVEMTSDRHLIAFGTLP